MPRIDVERLKESAEIVFNRTNYFNDYTLQMIGRRIKSIGQLSAADQIALKNLADITGDMQKITKKLADITQLNLKDIERIYTQTMKDSVESYKPLFVLKNKPYLPFEKNDFAKHLVEHWFTETAGSIINLSKTKALCFEQYDLLGNVIGTTPLSGMYQKVVDDAVIAISSGTIDFNSAMRETIKQLGGSSVRVDYGNNITRRLDGMVRQNLLYGAKQSAQAYDDYIGDVLGCDGFEVDYHSNPRPTHEFMGGKVFSYSGDKTIDGVTYPDGTEALNRLRDYGCLHFKTDLILGVSEPTYNTETVERWKERDSKPIEYNGKEYTGYQLKQMQRRLENATREQKDIAFMAKSSGDTVLAQQANDKVRAYMAKYSDLCDKTGLQPTTERMAAYGANKAVNNSYQRGIINTPKQITEVKNVRYIGKIDRDIYKCVTEDICTDEVIITDERIQHIKERHPNDYERFYSYIPEIILKPDYIVEANKNNTAVILKELELNNEKFKIILKIATPKDPKEYKNSVISFWKIGDTTWKKTLKNKKILYESE